MIRARGRTGQERKPVGRWLAGFSKVGGDEWEASRRRRQARSWWLQRRQKPDWRAGVPWQTDPTSEREDACLLPERGATAAEVELRRGLAEELKRWRDNIGLG